MAYHTYEILKRRKNDPNGERPIHLFNVGINGIIGTLVTINIIIWFFCFVIGKKNKQSGDIEFNIIDVLKSKINEFLN